MTEITIYTDGSCLGNPGKGGIGGVIIDPDGTEREFQGGFRLTTNNRMEIYAIIFALERLSLRRRSNTAVIVYSDSSYVVNAFNQKWIEKWIRKGWHKSKNKPIPNRALWQRLNQLAQAHQVQFRKVKAHAGHKYNERADTLATEAAAQTATHKVDIGYENANGASLDQKML